MNLTVQRILTILRREYVLRVKNKWFLVTTFGLPVLIVGITFLPALLLGTGGPAEPFAIGLVDRIGIEQRELAALLAEEDSTLRVTAVEVPATADRDTLARRLRTSSLDAFLVVEPATDTAGADVSLDGPSSRATLYARSGVGERRQRAIRDGVRHALVVTRLGQAGLGTETAESVVADMGLRVDVARVDREGARSQELLSVLALAFIFVLYMMFIIYGQMIARGVIEEKTSDIAEILLATVRPWELMLGKILGIGAVGLTQIAIWITTMGLISLYGFAAAAPALAEVGVSASSFLALPLVRTAAVFLVFFVLGFFLYAAIFAAVGAVAEQEQELQQVAFLPMLLIILPFVLAFTGIQTPEAAWMTGASFFPFFTPFLMLLRITLGVAQTWEVLVSIGLLVVTIFGVAWLAGRIYRVGLLMTGKRPTLPELVRWLRYG